MRKVFLCIPAILFWSIPTHAAKITAGRISFAADRAFYNNKPETLLAVLKDPRAKFGHLELLSRIMLDQNMPNNLYQVVYDPGVQKIQVCSEAITYLMYRSSPEKLTRLNQFPHALDTMKKIAFDKFNLRVWLQGTQLGPGSPLYALDSLLSFAEGKAELGQEIARRFTLPTHDFWKPRMGSITEQGFYDARIVIDAIQFIAAYDRVKAETLLADFKELFANVRETSGDWAQRKYPKEFAEIYERLAEVKIPGPASSQALESSSPPVAIPLTDKEKDARVALSTQALEGQRRALIALNAFETLEVESLEALIDYAEGGGPLARDAALLATSYILKLGGDGAFIGDADTRDLVFPLCMRLLARSVNAKN